MSKWLKAEFEAQLQEEAKLNALIAENLGRVRVRVSGKNARYPMLHLTERVNSIPMQKIPTEAILSSHARRLR